MTEISTKQSAANAPEQSEREVAIAPLGPPPLAQVEAEAMRQREILQSRVVDQREEHQLYQSVWSALGGIQGSIGAGQVANSDRGSLLSARDELSQFIATQRRARRRLQASPTERKRLLELYADSDERRLQEQQLHRSLAEHSTIEVKDDAHAAFAESAKETGTRLSPLETAVTASTAPKRGDAPVTPENSRAALQSLMADIARLGNRGKPPPFRR